MMLNRQFSVCAAGAVILLIAVFSGCVATAAPVSLYRPTAQNQANLTVDQWIERGDSFYYRDDYANAKECYFRALMADPSRVDVLNSYGVTLANTGFYENAIVIFNLALQIDPYDDVVRSNVSFCRQQIAARTEQQRQLQLQAQREQQESFNSLVNSLNTLAASMQQQQQGHYSGSGSYNADDDTGGSSSQRQGHIARNGLAWAQNIYRRYEYAIEGNLRTLERATDSRLRDEIRRDIRDSQEKMRAFREEAESQGVHLTKSRLEDRNV